MTTNAFGFPESASERMMREMMEKERRLDDMLGLGRYKTILESIDRHKALLAPLDRYKEMIGSTLKFTGPALTLQQTLQADRDRMNAMVGLGSAWAARSGSAIDLALRDQRLLDEQRKLADLVGGSFKALDAVKPLFSTAMKAAAGFSSVQKMLGSFAPQMASASMLAERMLRDDFLTPWLSVGADGRTPAADVAETIIEMQRIAEAIGDTTNADEGAQLVVSFLDTVSGVDLNYWQKLAADWKTKGPVDRMNLYLAVIGIVIGLMLYLADHPQLFGVEDADGFDKLSAHVAALEKGFGAFHTAEVEAETAYIAGLPRAQLFRGAVIRADPKREGAIVLKATAGVEVAVSERRGRWRKIVFRDPLSQHLAQGWIYQTALMPLAETSAE